MSAVLDVVIGVVTYQLLKRCFGTGIARAFVVMAILSVVVLATP